jgi:hypothetical protein
MRTDSVLAVFIRTSRAAQGIGLLLTHIVIAIQDPWFGFGWATTDLAILAAITIAAAIPAIWLFRWD